MPDDTLEALEEFGKRRLGEHAVDYFASLVDPFLHPISGSVFYAGRDAFSALSPVYILGLNPGGDPLLQNRDTIETHIRFVRECLPGAWSAYCDESWRGQKQGEAILQRRVRHLLERIGRDPRLTPSSNLIFRRSKSTKTLSGGVRANAAACWAFHAEVISRLKVRMVICMGRDTGFHVRRYMQADGLHDSFTESGRRQWTNFVHSNASGQLIATLTHPSWSDWTSEKYDPSPMLNRHLEPLL